MIDNDFARTVSVFDKALDLAGKAHKDQKYGNKPYLYHLFVVDTILARFNFTLDLELRAAGLLHDVVEDTRDHHFPVTIEQIREQFSERITRIVDLVTLMPGKNRKEKFAASLPRIAQDDDAIIIKLADRIANVRESVKTKDSKFQMYKKEYPNFRQMLRSTDPIRLEHTRAMWDELDELMGWEK